MRISNLLIFTLIIPTLILGYIFTPSSFFIDSESISFSDMCTGDTVQTVVSNRHSIWDIPGEVESLLIFYTDENFRIETDIRREANFTYESNITEVTYQIKWDKPVMRVGTYGAQSNETIYPVWFWPIKTFNNAEDRAFNVIDC